MNKDLLITFKLIKFHLKKQTKIKDLSLIKQLTNDIYNSLSSKSQLLIILYLILIKYFEINYNKLNNYQSTILNNNINNFLREI